MTKIVCSDKKETMKVLVIAKVRPFPFLFLFFVPNLGGNNFVGPGGRFISPFLIWLLISLRNF